MNIESVTLAHLKVINNTYGVMVMIYLESMCGFCGGPVLKWLGSPKKLDLEVTNGAQLINLQSSSTGWVPCSNTPSCYFHGQEVFFI